MGSVPERATQFESPSGPPSIPGVKNYADSTRFRESQAGFQPIEQTIGDRPPITYPEQNWFDKFKQVITSGGRLSSLPTRALERRGKHRQQNKWQI